jgi:hypothetical protein
VVSVIFENPAEEFFGCMPLNSLLRRILVIEPSITKAENSILPGRSHARTKESRHPFFYPSNGIISCTQLSSFNCGKPFVETSEGIGSLLHAIDDKSWCGESNLLSLRAKRGRSLRRFTHYLKRKIST